MITKNKNGSIRATGNDANEIVRALRGDDKVELFNVKYSVGDTVRVKDDDGNEFIDMNRDIKFRAWHKGLNQMLPNIQNHIGNDGWAFGQLLNNIEGVEIMQFTGLTDKNGKEIYELHEINNQYRVVYSFNKYILQDISNSDIFVEISENGQYEITREYCPVA